VGGPTSALDTAVVDIAVAQRNPRSVGDQSCLHCELGQLGGCNRLLIGLQPCQQLRLLGVAEHRQRGEHFEVVLKVLQIVSELPVRADELLQAPLKLPLVGIVGKTLNHFESAADQRSNNWDCRDGLLGVQH